MIIVPPSHMKLHDSEQVYTGMNLVCTGLYWYVPWALIYFWECFFVSNECQKRYYLWVTCRRWYSNTKYITLLVFKMHNFVLVCTQYKPVWTLNFVHMSIYWYVPVCTSTNQGHTKNTVLVQPVRIPLCILCILCTLCIFSS